MKFDQDEMVAVARAILMLNPYADGDTVENIVTQMESRAQRYLYDGEGYIATYGYVLTAFKHPTGGVGVKASVAAHLFEDEWKRRSVIRA